MGSLQENYKNKKFNSVLNNRQSRSKTLDNNSCDQDLSSHHHLPLALSIHPPKRPQQINHNQLLILYISDLLKLYIDESSRRISNGLESFLRENHGGSGGRRSRHGGDGIINDLDLNALLRNASPGLLCAYAPYQVLPPTRRPIIPYSISGRRKQVAGREL